MTDFLPRDFDYLADMLVNEGGMVVEPDKHYLITTRLMPVAAKHGLSDVDSLIDRLRKGNDVIKHDVVDAMTVNETSFFRDPRVWDEIGAVLLPQIFEHCRVLRRLEIWIAASSSGQEVYTIAMLLREMLGSDYGKWRIQIIASDLSREMVARTKAGRYSEYETSRGLSKERRNKYMSKDGKDWVVNDDLRSIITAREGNLTSKDMGVRGPFDLILLRNVLIYFKPAMRTEILSRQAGLLNKNGWLVLGASEGALGVPPNLRSVRTGSLVSYGRADAAFADKVQHRGGLSAATSALMAQFPKGESSPPTSPAAAKPLTEQTDASKLSTLTASAPTPDKHTLASGLTAKTPTPDPTNTSPAILRPPMKSPSNEPEEDGTLLGSAKVDEDGLTPLERLRALRKEYQK